MRLVCAAVRTAWFLLTFGVSALIGCAHVPPAPPGALASAPRLYLVAPGIYRSAQPSAAEFRDLAARYGIKSVLKLNSALEGHDELPVGVDLFHDFILPAGPVDHEDLVQALTDLENAPRPILIHCSHVRARDGLAPVNCRRAGCGHTEALHSPAEGNEIGGCWACRCQKFTITPAPESPKNSDNPLGFDDGDDQGSPGA